MRNGHIYALYICVRTSLWCNSLHSHLIMKKLCVPKQMWPSVSFTLVELWNFDFSQKEIIARWLFSSVNVANKMQTKNHSGAGRNSGLNTEMSVLTLSHYHTLTRRTASLFVVQLWTMKYFNAEWPTGFLHLQMTKKRPNPASHRTLPTAIHYKALHIQHTYMVCVPHNAQYVCR